MDELLFVYHQLEEAEGEDRVLYVLGYAVKMCGSGRKMLYLRRNFDIPAGFLTTLARLYWAYSLATKHQVLQLACALSGNLYDTRAFAMFADYVGLFGLSLKSNLLLIKLALYLLRNIVDGCGAFREQFRALFEQLVYHHSVDVHNLLFDWLEALSYSDEFDFFEDVAACFCPANERRQFYFAALHIAANDVQLPDAYIMQFSNHYLHNPACGAFARACAIKNIELEIDGQAVLDRLHVQFLPFEVYESLILVLYYLRSDADVDVRELSALFYIAKDATLEVLQYLSGAFQLDIDPLFARDAAVYAARYCISSRDCVRDIIAGSANYDDVIRFLRIEEGEELIETLDL